jgi:hypothetical protein
VAKTQQQPPGGLSRCIQLSRRGLAQHCWDAGCAECMQMEQPRKGQELARLSGHARRMPFQQVPRIGTELLSKVTHTKIQSSGSAYEGHAE